MRRSSGNYRVVICVALCLIMAAALISTDGPLLKWHPMTGGVQVLELPLDFLAIDAKAWVPLQDLRIPENARRICHRRVRLNGTMFPTFESAGITQFVFIPETGQRPFRFMDSTFPLHTMITATTRDGCGEDYQQQPFTIEGTFEIDIECHEGKVVSIYHLRDARIIQKAIRLRGRPGVNLMTGC